MTRPLVALGSRLSERQPGEKESIWSSAVLGIATGLLWAPCAGPILGIIFTAAALQGASASTTLLLLAYALGAATSLALALLVGGKVFARMKKSLGASERIRQVLGVLVLVGVAAIALGLDTRVLSKLSSAQTASLESGLARKLGASQAMDDSQRPHQQDGRAGLPVEGELPPLDGLGPWFNSAAAHPRAAEGQGRGHRLLDLQLHQLPALAPLCEGVGRKIPQGRPGVIGVHAPEFAFEREPANVARAVEDLGIRYPVALDNDYVLWRALKNNYWPAHYFVDAQGRVRYHHFGEGDYAMSERVIRQLLAEAGHAPADAAMAQASAVGRRGRGRARRDRARPRPTSATRAPTASSRPAGCCTTRPRPMPARRSSLNDWSLEGAWHRRQAERAFARAAERRSASASTPATSTSCSARRPASRCAFG